MPDPLLYLNPHHYLNLASRRWQDQGLRCYIAGMSGSGKTNLVAVICEELHGLGVPFVIVDPMDDYRSLRELGGVVVCGEGDDIELSYPASDWVSQVIVTLAAGYSVVVDIRRLRALSDKRVACTLLTEALLAHQIRVRQPMFYVIEEAHLFCPQKRQQDIQALEAIEEIQRQGRRSGINSILISQRPRDLEADIASQCNLSFVGHLEFSLDYEAVKYLLYVPRSRNGNGYRPPGMIVTQVEATPDAYDLMKLQAGEFYMRMGGRLDLIEVRRRRTEHIGATPIIQYQQKGFFDE